jgi:multidrug resistance efflux pump
MMAAPAAAPVGAPAQLRASTLAWRRLRRIVLWIVLIAGTGSLGLYLLRGGFILNADGLVLREPISVSAPYDARIKQVMVRPGDHVEKGQTIAIVESPSLSRTLAELSLQHARITVRISELEARQKVVDELHPIADESASQARAFLDELNKAGARGLTVSRSLQEISAAHLAASERAISLKAEKETLASQIAVGKAALDETNAAYEQMRQVYDNGVIRTPVAGYVGSKVALAGEVLSPGKDQIARILTGKSFVLAFLPESYFFDIEPGERVSVKARGRTVTGTVQQVLPVTDALPPEFQPPNKVRNRGQVVRIALQDPNAFAVEEKVRVTGCMADYCNTGVMNVVRSLFGGSRNVATDDPTRTLTTKSESE